MLEPSLLSKPTCFILLSTTHHNLYPKGKSLEVYMILGFMPEFLAYFHRKDFSKEPTHKASQP